MSALVLISKLLGTQTPFITKITPMCLKAGTRLKLLVCRTAYGTTIRELNANVNLPEHPYQCPLVEAVADSDLALDRLELPQDSTPPWELATRPTWIPLRPKSDLLARLPRHHPRRIFKEVRTAKRGLALKPLPRRKAATIKRETGGMW
jgi:hypothetical protein